MALDKEQLLKSKTFCMAPWVHVHLSPNGNLFPCCRSNPMVPFGKVSSGRDLVQAWNSPAIRALRLRMLQGQNTKTCEACYETEASGAASLRTDFNQRFSHHLKAASETQADGSIKKTNFVYMDLRFSNLCNLKCRTCTPDLSTGWSEDAKNLQLKGGDIGLQKIFSDLEEMKGEISKHLLSLEKIYFAGGEPLLMKEHDSILRLLDSAKRYDIELGYNSNFSTQIAGSEELHKIWSKFKNVTVGASIDAIGEKAELLRKGSSWDLIKKNRQILLKNAPSVKFHINFTLGALNLFEAPKVHKEFLKEQMILPDNFNFNYVSFPSYYSVEAVPAEVRQRAIESFETHVMWLKENYPTDAINFEKWTNAIQWMQRPFRADLNKILSTKIEMLDNLRNENYFGTFSLKRREFFNSHEAR